MKTRKAHVKRTKETLRTEFTPYKNDTAREKTSSCGAVLFYVLVVGGEADVRELADFFHIDGNVVSEGGALLVFRAGSFGLCNITVKILRFVAHQLEFFFFAANLLYGAVVITDGDVGEF